MLAYGQTGSGKSFTMLGASGALDPAVAGGHLGLIPRLCNALFQRVDQAEERDTARLEWEREMGARASSGATLGVWPGYDEVPEGERGQPGENRRTSNCKETRWSTLWPTYGLA